MQNQQFPNELKGKEFKRAILAIIGGIFIHLTIGSFYLWGSLRMYVMSYFYIYNHNLNYNLVNIVFPLMTTFNAIMMPFGTKLLQLLGSRKAAFIEGSFLSLGVFISSFTKTFYLFFIFYAVFFGLMMGMLYMIPVYIGCRYFPKRKGMISGIAFGAFGIGALVSS